MHGVDRGKSLTTYLSIYTNLDSNIINIAVFGIDERESEVLEGIRADSVIIASLNKDNGEIKLTSVSRDTLVFISTVEEVVVSGKPYTDNVKDSDNYAKLNASFDLGGAGTVIKTLNTNLDLNIDNYVLIDFSILREIVDMIGGITVNITDEKFLNQLNDLIYTINIDENRDDPYIEDIGEQLLNGPQVLAYVRERFSDSESERMLRQREIISEVLTKVRSLNLFSKIQVLLTIYPSLDTSLSLKEIYDLSKIVLNSSELQIEEKSIPTTEYERVAPILAGTYIFPYTLVDNVKILHEFLYSTDYEPTKTVEEISQEILDIYSSETSFGSQ